MRSQHGKVIETMEAKQLVDLLAVRHRKDVFVRECKTGPSMTGAKHVRFDAWAMQRSWSKPNVYGYEVKVSRSDFLQDDKWPSYLPFCNYFSFVAAPGVIQPEEIPEGCGLIVASSTGTRLFTKRKAPRRDVGTIESVLRYVLMSRAVVGTPSLELKHDSNEEYWRDWLAEKRERRELGHRVSREIRELVNDRITSVEIQNIELKKRVEKYEALAAVLDELGINPHEWKAGDRLREAMEEGPYKKPPRRIARAIRKLGDAAEIITKWNAEEPTQ